MKNLFLALGFAMSLASIGCQKPALPIDARSDLWLKMRYDPIELGLALEGSLSVRREYGDYVVYSNHDHALLLDREGNAVWAGSHVLPIRIDGEIGCIVLMKAYRNWQRQEGCMYEITRLHELSFKAQPDLENCGDAFIRVDQTGMSPWVMDIDADGNDELIMVRVSNDPSCVCE